MLEKPLGKMRNKTVIIFFWSSEMTQVVYAITVGKRLLYIGRTNDFNRRRREHLRNIYSDRGAKRFRKAFSKFRSSG